MQQRYKRPGPDPAQRAPDIGGDRSSADDGAGASDPEVLLGECLEMIGTDVRRLRELTKATGRVLNGEEASTIATYARTLVQCLARKTGGPGRGSANLDDLIGEAMQIPEVREALRAAGHE